MDSMRYVHMTPPSGANVTSLESLFAKREQCSHGYFVCMLSV